MKRTTWHSYLPKPEIILIFASVSYTNNFYANVFVLSHDDCKANTVNQL